ncbi:hypothetical protein AXZ95_2763 [Leifsonia sp. 115AMFTsu3.1]|nr:hypothetical protein AXZ95_2763 [Leifsonia sp. 115AMFTsu3.1]
MAARQVGHLASTVRRGGSDSADVLARLDDMHREVRTRCSALLILADSPLAEAALTVQRQVYAVVEVARGGEDPRPGDGTPDERLTRALDALSHRARNQLDLAPIAGTRLD